MQRKIENQVLYYKNHIKILIIFFMTVSFCLTQGITSTTKADTLNPKLATFTEISFKNKKSDWIKIKLTGHLDENTTIRISGRSLNYTLKTNKFANKNFILIHFKSEQNKEEENGKTLEIFTTKKGLIATNEELKLEIAGQITDSVCWEKNPSQKISCIKSAEVKTDETIKKIGGTWEIQHKPIQKIPEKKQTKPPTRTSQKPSDTRRQNNTASDSPPEVLINEIFPNPIGKDKNNEWIELKNISEKDIDLKNWKLIINGKTKNLNGLIKKNEYKILESKNFKFTLNNTDGEIQLINQRNKIEDKINYTEVQEDKSFSKVDIFENNIKATQLLWITKTKNTKNQTLYKFQGEVSKTNLEENYFEIDDTKIYIDDTYYNKNFLAPLLKNNIDIVADKRENNYFLIKFKTLDTNPKDNENQANTKNWKYYLLIPIPILLAIIIKLSKVSSSPS